MAKPEGWEEKKHAYSLLLNASVLSELHSNQILAMLQGEVRITQIVSPINIMVHQGASKCEGKCY